MSEQTLIIVSILAFIIAGFLVKNRSYSNLGGFSANKSFLNWFVIGAGITMSFIGGAALINTAGIAYVYGWQALIDPLSFAIGIGIASFFVRAYRGNPGVTMAELLVSNSTKLSFLVGVITSAIFVLISAAQFVAFSKLLAPYFPGYSPFALILIPSIIILSYVIIGGFRAITNTDILQLLFIIAFFICPILLYISSNHSISTNSTNSLLDQRNFQTMPAELASLLGIAILYIPISQDINVRMKSARNVKHAKFGLLFGTCMYFIIVGLSAFIGVYTKKIGYKLDDPEQAYGIFFRSLPHSIGIVAIIAGLAAIWSTLDTYLVNSIGAFSQDILKKFPYINEIADKRLILLSGVFLFSLSMVLAIIFNQVLSLVLLSLLIYITLLLPISIGRMMNVNQHYLFFSSIITFILIVLFEIASVNVPLKAFSYPSIGLSFVFFGRLFIKQRITR